MVIYGMWGEVAESVVRIMLVIEEDGTTLRGKVVTGDKLLLTSLWVKMLDRASPRAPTQRAGIWIAESVQVVVVCY
jgi:hypothetical protein